MAYKIGNRMQQTFLPNIIDDYITVQDPVRAYDAFVDALDFESLGIHIEPHKAGADEYYPKAMLKLLIYGYSYGFKSSRKLERACHHNVSFMWLINNLKPDYRTIARFRTKHKQAIKQVLKQCVKLCIKLDLIEGNTLFLDGSLMRANASIKNTWTKERCQKHLKKLEQYIDKLVEETEVLDKQEDDKDSLVKLKKELQNKKELQKQIQDIASELKHTQSKQLNTTDIDCVKVKSRGGKHTGYNAQITTDEKHGLIVNSETVSSNQDANQFSSQVKGATRNLNKKPQAVCSDSGYHSLKDLEKVDEDIIIVMPSQKQAQEENGHPLGTFDKDNFKYDAEKDQYLCPEGKHLKYTSTRRCGRCQGTRQYQAKASVCRACRHFKVCTESSNGRKITRLKQEELKNQLEAIYKSTDGQEIYKLRKQKVELPFGHMKRNLNAGQFMLRGKSGTDAELSILSTCFNMSRMITLIGIPKLILRLNKIERIKFFVDKSTKHLFCILNPKLPIIYQRTLLM